MAKIKSAITASSPQLKFTIPLLPYQQEIDASPARIKVVVIGRRAGKSFYASIKCIQEALKGKLVWWIAPVQHQTEVGFRYIKQLLSKMSRQMHQHGISIEYEVTTKPYRVILHRGQEIAGEIHFKSACEPDSLRGWGIDFAVLDEAQDMDEDAFTDGVDPALLLSQGSALLIGTPTKGKNWFHKYFERGRLYKDRFPDYDSFQYPSTVNPQVTKEWMEQKKNSLTKEKYESEYLALFQESSGSVFRNIRKNVDPFVYTESPLKDHKYIVSVDWGQKKDFSVFTVIDATMRNVVFIERVNGIEYIHQRERLAALCRKFNPYKLIAENNSIGQTNIEELKRMENIPSIFSFTMTNPAKRQIVDELVRAFEKNIIRIYDNPTLISELETFTVRTSAHNNIQFEAEKGHFDDHVISLAIGWWYLVRPHNKLFTWDRASVAMASDSTRFQ